jgi:hypothetical protein
MALTGNVYGAQSVAKAWVNFNGTGTLAIRDSFNVTSITDNGSADYTVNFTTAMASANYVLTGSGTRSSTDPSSQAIIGVVMARGTDVVLAGSVRLALGTANSSGTDLSSATDFDSVHIAIFGDQ